MKQEERLTTYSDGIAIPNMENEASENVIFTKITVRLAEYEDTGLSPAEVEELKHRADVAEEALRNGAVGEDLYCSSDDERHRLYLHLIREAEERLKERV